MAKGNDDTTQHLPAIKLDEQKSVKPDPDYPTVKGFAARIESLMNEAYQQSQPAEGQPATEHHRKFADWCNHLGDLWREVKNYA